MENLKTKLAHVLWIGGSTDAGKTTVAYQLAEQFGMELYRFDVAIKRHFDLLVQTNPKLQLYHAQSDEERWVKPSPKGLFDWLLYVFGEQWPLVLEDLLALPTDKLVLTEGFGFLPEIVAPLLSSPYQAIWLVPTESFKWQSMKPRQKYTRRLSWSDPERAINNLFRRDMMLVDLIREQTAEQDLTLLEIDGSDPAGVVAQQIAKHFTHYRPLDGK